MTAEGKRVSLLQVQLLGHEKLVNILSSGSDISDMSSQWERVIANNS